MTSNWITSSQNKGTSKDRPVLRRAIDHRVARERWRIRNIRNNSPAVTCNIPCDLISPKPFPTLLMTSSFAVGAVHITSSMCVYRNAILENSSNCFAVPQYPNCGFSSLGNYEKDRNRRFFSKMIDYE